MTRYLAGPLIALAVLSGCASIEPPPPNLSPAQAFHAADRTYESMLRAAIDYKDSCVSRPVPLQAQCYPVVQVLRDVNREAQQVREYGEIAIAEGSVDLLPEATKALEDLRDKLRQKVLEQMAVDAAAQKATVP